MTALGSACRLEIVREEAKPLTYPTPCALWPGLHPCYRFKSSHVRTGVPRLRRQCLDSEVHQSHVQLISGRLMAKVESPELPEQHPEPTES